MRKKEAPLERIFDRQKKEPKQLVSGKIKHYSFSRETVKTFGQSLFFYKFYSQLKLLDELKFFPFSKIKNVQKERKRKNKSGILFPILKEIIISIIASIKDGIIVALARLLFEYLLLAGQFAGPYYLCILKQSNNSQVRAFLETRPTYLAGET